MAVTEVDRDKGHCRHNMLHEIQLLQSELWFRDQSLKQSLRCTSSSLEPFKTIEQEIMGLHCSRIAHDRNNIKLR